MIGPLHEPRAGLDRRERVRHPALGVIVGVDADRDPLAELGRDRGRGAGDLPRQARAVGVAQRHVLGSGRDRGAQALHRVSGVVAPGIEEVLGVVDHSLALRAAVVDRVDDHRHVLLAADPGDLLEVKSPRLADQGDDGREAADELAQRRVLLGGDASAPRHAEGADRGLVELDGPQQREQLAFLGVGAGEARLDEGDAEPVERLHDADPLGRRERHALALHAVAKRRVVEVYVVCLGHFECLSAVRGK